jgi:hypothetical protein
MATFIKKAVVIPPLIDHQSSFSIENFRMLKLSFYGGKPTNTMFFINQAATDSWIFAAVNALGIGGIRYDFH